MAHACGTDRLGDTFLRRVRRRRAADNWLRTATGTFVPEKYAWRAEELCSARNRIALARVLRRLNASAWSGRPRLAVLHLPAVRTCNASLLALVLRLEALSRPVTPVGVLWVHELISDGSSPLYGAQGIDVLGGTIERAIELLDLEPTPRPS